jgi:hypothetical protein
MFLGKQPPALPGQGLKLGMAPSDLAVASRGDQRNCKKKSFRQEVVVENVRRVGKGEMPLYCPNP